MNFKGFLGNERAKQYIGSAFERGTVPHALLIAGERGIGKKTFASIISRALVCTGTDKPCGTCDSCIKAKKGTHPDIRILGEDSSVRVDEIRKLKHDALIRPNDSDRKVYIINNAGAMTQEAQDAFLKILEEPPLFTFFILLCYNYSDLLPTIVSRTARITLSPLSEEEVFCIIKEKFPDLSSDEQKELVRTSGGICSFIGEAKNDDVRQSTKLVAEALVSCDEFEIFKAFSSFEKKGKDFLLDVLDELLLIIRDSIIIATGSKASLVSPLPDELSEKLSKLFSPKLSYEFLNCITEAKTNCRKNIGVSHIIGNLISEFTQFSALRF